MDIVNEDQTDDTLASQSSQRKKPKVSLMNGVSMKVRLNLM